jgi:hypothetical protein
VQWLIAVHLQLFINIGRKHAENGSQRGIRFTQADSSREQRKRIQPRLAMQKRVLPPDNPVQKNGTQHWRHGNLRQQTTASRQGNGADGSPSEARREVFVSQRQVPRTHQQQEQASLAVSVKWVLQEKITGLRIFLGKYLQIWGGDF